MKTLQSVHTVAVTVDNLLSAYGDTAVRYVSDHTVDGKKYPPERYGHLYARADARKAVYDAAKECEKAALALDDANEKLVAALRELRRLT